MFAGIKPIYFKSEICMHFLNKREIKMISFFAYLFFERVLLKIYSKLRLKDLTSSFFGLRFKLKLQGDSRQRF